MKFEVDYSPEDLRAGMKLILKNPRPSWQWLFRLPIAYVLAYHLYTWYNPNHSNGVALLLFFLFFQLLMVGLYFLRRGLILRQAAQLKTQSKLYAQPGTWSFNHQQICITCPTGQMQLDWDFFMGYRLNRHSLVLWASPKHTYILPLRHVPPLQQEAITNLLDLHCKPY